MVSCDVVEGVDALGCHCCSCSLPHSKKKGIGIIGIGMERGGN